jgi:hypothetical protein
VGRAAVQHLVRGSRLAERQDRADGGPRVVARAPRRLVLQ